MTAQGDQSPPMAETNFTAPETEPTAIVEDPVKAIEHKVTEEPATEPEEQPSTPIFVVSPEPESTEPLGDLFVPTSPEKTDKELEHEE